MTSKLFTDLGLSAEVLKAIDKLGYEQASPIQAEAIPVLLTGRDIVGQSQTGSGKTAAFGIPAVEKVDATKREVQVLILCPTRELAIQIAQTLEGIAYFTNVSSIAVYGGGSGTLFSAERKALSSGADIVICTPGRMISHLNMGYVKLEGLKYLVLDEADRMLDMGFFEDIMKIIGYMPAGRQNLLFSATMPPAIRKLAGSILRNPVEVNIAISKPPEQIKQEAFIVYDAQKIPLVKYILSQTEFKSVLIFCSSKLSVKQLTEELKRGGFSVGQIQSDLEQEQREQVLLDFKSDKLKILVATDILSRGIHIEDIDLVINYDVPHDGEDYIHRIGRTARAASKGTAYTFVSDKEQGKFLQIEQLLGKPVTKAVVPEQFGPVPELRTFMPRTGGGGSGSSKSGGKSKSRKFKKK